MTPPPESAATPSVAERNPPAAAPTARVDAMARGEDAAKSKQTRSDFAELQIEPGMLDRIFGPGGKDLLASGDAATDKQRVADFLALAGKGSAVVDGTEGHKVLAFGGKGCSVCKQSGWLEMLGAGLVHPNVFKACGVDRTALRAALKKLHVRLRKAQTAKQSDEIKKVAAELVRAYDKAAQKKVITRNTAARKKSRLAAAVRRS